MTLEVTDEKWLQRECRKRGMMAVKLTLLLGIPDRMILAPGARVAFCELKTPVGSLSAMQKWWQRKLRAMGFFCECISSRERMVAVLDAWDREINAG